MIITNWQHKRPGGANYCHSALRQLKRNIRRAGVRKPLLPQPLYEYQFSHILPE
jgi:hypothetical protein